jgi:hypothetical protein
LEFFFTETETLFFSSYEKANKNCFKKKSLKLDKQV